MYFVAAVLAILSGLFYAAGHHEIGSFGVHDVPLWQLVLRQPAYVLVGAGLAAALGRFRQRALSAERPANVLR